MVHLITNVVCIRFLLNRAALEPDFGQKNELHVPLQGHLFPGTPGSVPHLFLCLAGQSEVRTGGPDRKAGKSKQPLSDLLSLPLPGLRSAGELLI